MHLLCTDVFSVSDLKGKALKVKDASVHKMANTRDKYQSNSSSKFAWDPNQKPPPPPPPTSRSSAAHSRTASSLSTSSTPSPPPPSRTSEWSRPPPVRHTSRPDETPVHTPSPPLTPARSPLHESISEVAAAAPRMDWANFTEADKQVFFSWLDEFFESRLNINIAAKETLPTVQRSNRSATPPKPPVRADFQSL